MGIPSKRGRGRAVAMPTNCATPKLQKILMQNSKSVEQQSTEVLEMYTPTQNQNTVDVTVETTNIEVDANYYDCIFDHDYCVNVPKTAPDIMVKTEPSEPQYPEDDILVLEDGEVLDNEFNEEAENLDQTSRDDSGIAGTFHNSDKNKQQRSKRNYRGRRSESPAMEDTGKYYDKIPSYYTALSLSASKRQKKSESNKSHPASVNVQDFFEPNPAPKSDGSVYSKLPAYYSCFTNSTKYDSNDNGKGVECSQESKSSSGYSSRSHSPADSDIRIGSRRDRRSRSRSFRSRSRDYRSRSRDLSARRRRGRSRYRRRRGSYSSSSRSRSRSSSASDYYR